MAEIVCTAGNTTSALLILGVESPRRAFPTKDIRAEFADASSPRSMVVADVRGGRAGANAIRCPPASTVRRASPAYFVSSPEKFL